MMDMITTLLAAMLLSQAPVEPSVSLTVKPSQCGEPCTIVASITVTGYEEERPVFIALYDNSDDKRPKMLFWFPWEGNTEVRLRDITTGGYWVVVQLESGQQAEQGLVVAGKGWTDASALTGEGLHHWEYYY